MITVLSVWTHPNQPDKVHYSVRVGSKPPQRRWADLDSDFGRLLLDAADNGDVATRAAP